MRVRVIALFLILVLLNGFVEAQSTYVPLGSASMYMLDRFEIKSGRLAKPSEFNTSTRSYRRSSIASYVDSFNVSGVQLSKQDYFNLSYLQNDNFEWSNAETTLSNVKSGAFYKHKAAAFDYVGKDYNIVINPLTLLTMGYDTRLKDIAYVNNRGLEIRGSIKGILGFYTQFSDEVNRMNSWLIDNYQKDSVIPGAIFLRPTSHPTTFNYWLASGYLTLNLSKYMDVQFGHGKNFIGNGIRTFYLSDFSTNHMFLRINTHIGKVNYTNIWGMVYDYTPPSEFILPRRHYYATTHLSMNLGKNFNIGCFQTISYQRDSGYAKGGIEYEYLNPVILYKPIENGLNSPDKAILGLDMKYNFLKRFSSYGQFVISEFVLHEVLAGNGWWANKQAIQLGIKCIDVLGINNLDLQAEFNQCRPYMYTSFDSKNAWVNYHQNMAHPYGANFREFIAIVKYQPVNRLFLKATANFSMLGKDTGGSNWGSDIRMSYYSRQRSYGNYIGQGVKTNLYLFDISASYMIRHNLFLELQLYYRKTSSELSVFNTQTILMNTSIRWNISERRYDF